MQPSETFCAAAAYTCQRDAMGALGTSGRVGLPTQCTHYRAAARVRSLAPTGSNLITINRYAEPRLSVPLVVHALACEASGRADGSS